MLTTPELDNLSSEPRLVSRDLQRFWWSTETDQLWPRSPWSNAHCVLSKSPMLPRRIKSPLLYAYLRAICASSSPTKLASYQLRSATRRNPEWPRRSTKFAARTNMRRWCGRWSRAPGHKGSTGLLPPARVGVFCRLSSGVFWRRAIERFPYKIL